MTVFLVFRVFFYIFGQEKGIAKFFFIEVSSEICKASKERVTTCKDYVIGREVTTLLKIAVNNVILELCGSCAYFASPLLMEKRQYYYI